MISFARAVAVLAASMMIGVSLLLNFVFLASLGRDGPHGYVLGTGSVAADLMKALLPMFMAWAITQGRWVYVASAAPVFALLVVFSASNAIGFAGQNRNAVVGSREALNAEQILVETTLRELEADRTALPPHRPPSVVSELMAQAQQNRRFIASDSCKNASTPPSREFCDGYFRVLDELSGCVHGC